MNEEVPIIPAIIGVIALSYLGFELNRRRNQLREVFNVFDKDESVIAGALEELVSRGELKAYVPQ
jgi:hypothetical protein